MDRERDFVPTDKHHEKKRNAKKERDEIRRGRLSSKDSLCTFFF